MEKETIMKKSSLVFEATDQHHEVIALNAKLTNHQWRKQDSSWKIGRSGLYLGIYYNYWGSDKAKNYQMNSNLIHAVLESLKIAPSSQLKVIRRKLNR